MSEVIKRMFSLSKTSDCILDAVSEKKNKSDFVNKSIINNFVPCYSRTLRTASLCLLEIASGGNFLAMKGNPFIAQDTKLLSQYIDGILEEALKWLSRHTIKNPMPLKKIFAQYDTSSQVKQNDWRISSCWEDCYETRSDIERQLNIVITSALEGANAILANWEKFYQCSETYDFLANAIFCESYNKSNPITPLEAITILQEIESCVIDNFIKN